MTITEENNIRKQYATEDVTYVMNRGRLAICETIKGLVEVEYLGGGQFQVWNNTGALLTGLMNFDMMVNYVSKLYVFEK